MSKQELFSLLMMAFPPVTMSADRIADGPRVYDEVKRLRALAGRDWTSVNFGEAFSLHDCFWFLTREGVVAFLPAFLIACYDVDDADVLPDFLISWLGDQRVVQASGQLAGLNGAQRAVICVWLEHITRTIEPPSIEREARAAWANIWRCNLTDSP